MTIDDGGPAFPVSGAFDRHGERYGYSDGMTLRDYFAGEALKGLLSSEESNRLGDERLALAAYSLAEAMLKARNT